MVSYDAECVITVFCRSLIMLVCTMLDKINRLIFSNIMALILRTLLSPGRGRKFQVADNMVGFVGETDT